MANKEVFQYSGILKRSKFVINYAHFPADELLCLGKIFVWLQYKLNSGFLACKKRLFLHCVSRFLHELFLLYKLFNHVYTIKKFNFCARATSHCKFFA